MSKNNESETIRQQRIARQEFLELKKMQSGEIETGPKPSEVAIVPKTFSEKISNIWYHYGKLIIVAVFMMIAISVMVVQCATRTKYDLQIVYFTYSVVPDSLTAKMADYFEKYCDDVNGDGEVHISVINCSCNPNSPNDAKLSKLQAILVAEPSALLFVTDDSSSKYFDKISTSDEASFFDKNYKILSKDFYDLINEENFKLPQNLTLKIRNIKNTQIEREKNVQKCLDASKKILDKVK